MTPEQGRLAAAFAALSWLVSPALAQQSAALFDAPMVMFDENTSIRRLADVDGDGRLEALGWWYTSSYSYSIYLSLYRQDAAGAWPLAWRQTVVATPNIHREPVLDVGNFDGDARADWAISNRADLLVYRSQPDGTPSLLWSTLEPEPIERILVIDWDGDGRDDLAVATPTRIRLWRNAGSSFVMTGEVGFGATTGQPVNLERGDVNGDALPDLIHSDQFAVRLFTVQNQAPVLGQQFTHQMSDVRPASGDIDGDGDKDIVVFSTWPTPVRYLVLRRTGPGTFVQEPTAMGGPARYLVDVDGDGDLDGVCCGGGGGPTPSPNMTASTFRIALNDNGAFAPAISIPGMGSERLAAAVDIDGDGDIDLVGGRCIYYARGPIGSDPWVRPGGRQTVYDVEGDGDFDLDLRSGSVLRNSADGRFAAGTLPFPPAPAGTTWGEGGFAGDFDGDGSVDLLVRHLQGTQLLSMRLMRNCGGGFTDAGAAGPAGVDFHPLSEWQTDYKTSMAVDLDRDGDLDLLTFTRDGALSHFTLLWRNDGSGRFTAAGSFNIVIPMGAGDIDGDGWTDLLMAFPSGYLSGTLTWLRRTADFTFGQVAGFPAVSVAPFYDHVELVDVDGDGDLDILGGRVAGMVGGTPNPQTSLLLNTGAGAFQISNVLPPTEPIAVRRAWRRDIDGDGAMDMAIGQAFASLGTLYFRGVGHDRASGPDDIFAATAGVPPMVQQILSPTALFDFDGDGDLDALTDQGAVVRCVAIDGPGAGSIRQYGAGFVGTGGITPALGARGPMLAGALVEQRLVGVLGGSTGVLVFGTQPQELGNTPFPGMTLLVAPVITAFVPIGGNTGIAGAGTFTLPLFVPASMAGYTFYQQFFAFDPGAASGLSSSNGLETRIGLAR